MQKAYSRTNWENYPSDVSPINETNLNNIEAGVDEIDNRVITLDTTKATKTEVATLVKDISFEETTGIITITKKNGSVLNIDTKLEKIAVNFSYDENTQRVILTLIDGTKQYIDLSALVTQFEFLDTATIGIEITEKGEVKAKILYGSVTEDMLQPNFLADIKVEVAKAQLSESAAAVNAANAKISEDNAKTSEENAKSSETAAADSVKAASASATNAKNSAGAAADSAAAALLSENASATNATNASSYADSAKTSANAAGSHAETAGDKADEAKTSADMAGSKAKAASESAKQAESYTHGATGTRENEDTDNARYYYEQVKQLSQSANGIVPMGTVLFAGLPTAGMKYGWMYNISDDFISDERFNDGGGIYYGAGNNVIWTSEDKWDVTASSGVTGVKGENETAYRQGNVNITKSDIGLGNVENTSDKDKPLSTAAKAEFAAINDTLANALFIDSFDSSTGTLYTKSVS